MELARGGRYQIQQKEAVGITLYADALFQIVPYQKQKKKILLYSNVAKEDIDNLQKR